MGVFSQAKSNQCTSAWLKILACRASPHIMVSSVDCCFTTIEAKDTLLAAVELFPFVGELLSNGRDIGS